MSKEMQRYKEVMTPSWAAALLENNEQKMAQLGLKQRPVKQANVEMLKTEILRGEFVWGASAGVSLASNEAVLNGQHTLLAIIAADKAVTIDVWKNVPKEYFSKFDSAVGARSPRDIIEIALEDHASLLSRLLPKIVAYNQGTLGGFTVRSIPTEVLLDTLNTDRESIMDAVNFALDAEYRDSVVAFMHYVYDRAGVLDKVKDALQGFKTGADLKSGSIGLEFRSWVLGQGRNLRERKLMGVFFKFLNTVGQKGAKAVPYRFGTVGKGVNALKPWTDWSDEGTSKTDKRKVR